MASFPPVNIFKGEFDDIQLQRLVDRVHDSLEITDRTEYGGIFTAGGVATQTLATASDKIVGYATAYTHLKVLTATPGNNELVAAAALNFKISARFDINRLSGQKDLNMKAELFVNSVSVANVVIDTGPNTVRRVSFELASQAVGIGEVVEMKLTRNATPPSEDVVLTNLFLWMQSLT